MHESIKRALILTLSELDGRHSTAHDFIVYFQLWVEKRRHPRLAALHRRLHDAKNFLNSKRVMSNWHLSPNLANLSLREGTVHAIMEHQIWQLNSLTPLSLSVTQVWVGDEGGQGSGGEVGENGTPVGTVWHAVSSKHTRNHKKHVICYGHPFVSFEISTLDFLETSNGKGFKTFGGLFWKSTQELSFSSKLKNKVLIFNILFVLKRKYFLTTAAKFFVNNTIKSTV